MFGWPGGSVAERPNVLFMIADDHRHDAIRALGDRTVRTPALDALADQGVVFDHHHTQGGLSGAVCIPSRAQVLTGAGPFHSASSDRVDDTAALATLPPARPSLPELFRRAGYRTHATGKWHNDRASFARAFASAERVFFGGMSDHDAVPLHDFDPSGRYAVEDRRVGRGFSTELFGEAAIEFLGDRAADEPFFLYLAFTSPHDPRTPPAPFAAMYSPDELSLPPNFLPEHPFDNGELAVRDELLASFPRTPAEVRRHLADYYGMISHLDAWIARVVAAVPENTIVVYTADHGLALGQHGLMGKQSLYDHSIRVPLIVRAPDLPAGRRVDALTCHADLLPTLCGLAGLPQPDRLDGRDFRATIEGGRPPREVVCAVYKDVMRSASDGRWKLIRYHRSVERGVGQERLQLFDLAADPWETRDLSADPDARPELERLAAALGDWQRAADDPWADRPIL
jgi:arylsulfatase A-like enzyme